MPWTGFVHIGDIEHTLALAAAITTWLVVARASRMALWWSLLFTLGMGLVVVTKVAFMAWGITWHSLDFETISGHASGATAVFPTLFYLLLRRRGVRAQVAGVCAGLALGALMGLRLVLGNDHSAAEAAAGWITGAAISLGTIYMAGTLPTGRVRRYGLLCSTLVFASAAALIHALPYSFLMFRTAALLARI